jgi:hypothetical protein
MEFAIYYDADTEIEITESEAAELVALDLIIESRHDATMYLPLADEYDLRKVIREMRNRGRKNR